MAITIIYDLLKADINDKTKLELIKDFDYVLSLDLLTSQNDKEYSTVDADFEKYIIEKIEERKKAKKEKDFPKADAIRNELLEKGIVLKDTREGTLWELI